MKIKAPILGIAASTLSLIFLFMATAASADQLQDQDYDRLGIKETAGSYPSSGSAAPSPAPEPSHSSAPTSEPEPVKDDTVHKLLLNDEDLKRLGIKESHGAYQHGERPGSKFISEYRNHYQFQGKTRIKPGWWARCGHHFVLKNVSNDVAELQVALDGDHLQHLTLPAGNQKLFNLAYRLEDKDKIGQNKNVDDIGIVFNRSKKAVVEMDCS